MQTQANCVSIDSRNESHMIDNPRHSTAAIVHSLPTVTSQEVPQHPHQHLAPKESVLGKNACEKPQAADGCGVKMPTTQGPDLTIAAMKLTTQPLNNNQTNVRTLDIEAQGKDHETDPSSVQTPSSSHTVLAVTAIQTNQHISQSGLPSSHLSAVASRPIQSVVAGQIVTTGKRPLADTGDAPQLHKKARLSEKQPSSSALFLLIQRHGLGQLKQVVANSHPQACLLLLLCCLGRHMQHLESNHPQPLLLLQT